MKPESRAWIGRYPISYFGNNPRMKIQDEIRSCVAFIMSGKEPDLRMEGTVFFVGVNIPDTDRFCLYAVTARHIIDQIDSYPAGNQVYIRVNRSSDWETISTETEEWSVHPHDETVDVAVRPITMNEEWDHMMYPTSSFATDTIIDQKGIGLGEDIFIAGLFHLHSGKSKNTPIIRYGNIAAMPEERINTKWTRKGVEGFLIDTRSIHGLSGAPVFVHLGPINYIDGKARLEHNRYGWFYLLGLIHGHFDFKVPRIAEKGRHEVCNKVPNEGIAIVVPAAKILEVINQPKLKEKRDRLEAQIKEEMAATPDTMI
ncbi:MAG: hypothetical protein ACLP5H_29985 [Desulfomonilaceae bacterium]